MTRYADIAFQRRHFMVIAFAIMPFCSFFRYADICAAPPRRHAASRRRQDGRYYIRQHRVLEIYQDNNDMFSPPYYAASIFSC